MIFFIKLFFREALLKYVEVGLGGVRGMVRDQSGQGVAAALVTVEGIDKSMTSSSRGEYWRILAPGLYRLNILFEQTSIYYNFHDGRYKQGAVQYTVHTMFL